EELLGLGQPAKRSRQIITRDVADNFGKIAVGCRSLEDYWHQPPLAGFPAAASYASWRSVAQSDSVIGVDNPALAASIARSTRSRCWSGTGSGCSVFSRRAAPAASRAASFEGTLPPATMLARYCSLCCESS